jgi:hypothetical protein
LCETTPHCGNDTRWTKDLASYKALALTASNNLKNSKIYDGQKNIPVFDYSFSYSGRMQKEQ